MINNQLKNMKKRGLWLWEKTNLKKKGFLSGFAKSIEFDLFFALTDLLPYLENYANELFSF